MTTLSFHALLSFLVLPGLFADLLNIFRKKDIVSPCIGNGHLENGGLHLHLFF